MRQLLYLIGILAVTLLILLSIVDEQFRTNPLSSQLTREFEKARTK